MIRVENLVKSYGEVEVVRDVSFELADGEALALWGPNGAGKTTVVRCILGLAAYEGRVEVAGLDAARAGKAVRSLLGHVPQELAFYEDLTVGEMVEFSAQLRRVSPRRALDVIDTVDLGDELDKEVGALSGGMRQRLGIAVALLPDPPVLLLDEPTSNLDVSAREKAVDLFGRLRDEGRSLLLTSHHLEEVGMLVDRVLGMEEGRVTVECPPSELAERLGLQSWLHLVVDESRVPDALRILVDAGFAARDNGHGVLVEVSAQGKGEAIAALHDHGVELRDFEVWR